MADNSLTGADILESGLGVPESENANELDGLDSTADLSVHSGRSTFDSDSPKKATAFCPAGKAAISGGGDTFVDIEDQLPFPNNSTHVTIDGISVSGPHIIP